MTPSTAASSERLTFEEMRARIEVDEETGCWFGGSRTGNNWYRQAYEETYGPVPEGMQLDHLCGNPPEGRPKC